MVSISTVQFFRSQGFTPSRALALARAEEHAAAQGWSVAWATDEDATDEDALGDHEYWCDDAKSGKCGGHEVLACVLYDKADFAVPFGARRASLASLCGIIDPSRDYARVVAAELAHAAMVDAERAAAVKAGPYCRPLAAGLQSSERAVAARLARLVNGLDEVNGNVVEGGILDTVTSLRRTLLASLRAEGWRVDYVEDRHRWRVRAPQR